MKNDFSSELLKIKLSKPYWKCFSCGKCNLNEPLIFLSEEKIFLSTKCQNSNSFKKININNFYGKEKSSEELLISRNNINNSGIFKSSQELYNFVFYKISEIIKIKDKLINWINNSTFSETDKSNFVTKINMRFCRNLKINIECYKLLHFQLFNDLLLQKEGSSFNLPFKLNQNFFFDPPFDLIENLTNQFLSFLKYQFLILISNISHPYSYENSLVLNDECSYLLTMFDGRIVCTLIHKKQIKIYKFEKEEQDVKKKIIEIKTLNIDSTECIQLNTGHLCLIEDEYAIIVEIQQFNILAKVKVANNLCRMFKLFDGQLISCNQCGKFWTFNEKKQTLVKGDIIDIYPNDFEELRQIEINKILIICYTKIIHVYNLISNQMETTVETKYEVSNFFLINHKFFGYFFSFDHSGEVFDYISLRSLWQKDPSKLHPQSEPKQLMIPIRKDTVFYSYLNNEEIKFNKFSYEKICEKEIKLFITSFGVIPDGRWCIGSREYFLLKSKDEPEKSKLIYYEGNEEKQNQFSPGPKAMNYEFRNELIFFVLENVTKIFY